MTRIELALVLIAVSAIVLRALGRPRAAGRARLLSAAAIGLIVIGLATHTLRLQAAPMALVAGAAALVFLRPVPEIPRRVWRWLGALCLLFLLTINAAFVEIFDPLANDVVDVFSEGSDTPDLGALAYTPAFDQLHAHLSTHYAFGEWKQVDWNRLGQQFRPRIVAADAAHDRAAYYLALREYLWSFHDGHVELDGDDGGARDRAISGGFGFSSIRLDDGRTVAHVVLEPSLAADAGMKWGAEILQWNGIPIDRALEQQSVLWTSSPLATRESVRMAEARLLTRAPAGTQITVTFRNPLDAKPITATLVAADDQYEALTRAYPPLSFNITKDRALDWSYDDASGLGIIRLRLEFPTLHQLLPARTFRAAVRTFVDRGARGVILDVRGNFGGADKLVPVMMSAFVDSATFYESVTRFNEKTRQFETMPKGELWARPADWQFRGPVAILIDERCVSSCEGFPMLAGRMSNAAVVGFHGTYGSFGMSGASVPMPGGLIVSYPWGASLDASGRVQIDSNETLTGGIAPTLRVPLTIENVRAQFVHKNDVVMREALSWIGRQLGPVK